ncbi:hypothetical protein CLOM_g9343 [Closterium sp. NIES-68]|nr:hypothetical protein CLOM_g9343 [Closterium sp. NIES-68]GJP60809.1 hypothetical protein CLOP_g18027 [Closterium sp. NIES-67]
MMDVSTIEDALSRLVKRHAAVRAKELALLDKVQHALAQAQAALEAELQAERSAEHAGGVAERGEKEETIGTSADVAMDVSDGVSKPRSPSASLSSNPSCRAAASSLLSRLGGLGPEKEVAALHKELHGAVARLSKAVEREKDKGTFVADIGGAYREAVRFDRDIVNREIAKHLYREGLFDIGDAFVTEAGLGKSGRGEGEEEEEEAEEGEMRERDEGEDEGERMDEEGVGEGGQGKGEDPADVEAGGGGAGGGGERGGRLWGEGVSGEPRVGRLSWSARRRMASSGGGGGGDGGAAGAGGGGAGGGRATGGTESKAGGALGAASRAVGGVGGVGAGVSLQEHRRRYGAMHAILHAIRAKDLGPALAWAAQHREELQREVAGGFPDVKIGGGVVGKGEGGGGDGGKGVGGGLKTSSLEFEIHRLQFLNLLQEQQKQLILKQQQQQKGGSYFDSVSFASATNDDSNGQSRPATSAALQYARQHFPPFAATHLPDIQRLMSALLWIGRLHLSPYADLLPLTAAHWDQIAARFTADYCAVECLESSESPLAVVVAAGGEALPMLTKLAALLNHSSGIAGGAGGRAGESSTAAAHTTTAAGTFASTATATAGTAGAAAGTTSSTRRVTRDWQGVQQLPVEIELPRAFHFHSIFACPVSREPAAYPDNPPVLLPCGHVVCRVSVLKLAKGATRPFKCPYCPLETTPLDCRPIQF